LFRKIQNISIIVILEAILLYLAIVVLDIILILTPLTSFVMARFQNERLFAALGLATFIGYIGVFFAFWVSGFWISFWQRKENPLVWTLGAILGLVFVYILKPNGISYFYLPFILITWVGGIAGRKYRLKSPVDQNESKGIIRKIQTNDIVLVIEGIVFYIFSELAFILVAIFLLKQPRLPLMFKTAVSLFLVPFIIGFWIAFWQKQENQINWVTSIALGAFFFNFFFTFRYDYRYLPVLCFIAWIGGKTGRKIKERRLSLK
jgi:MFS family permease